MRRDGLTSFFGDQAFEYDGYILPQVRPITSLVLNDLEGSYPAQFSDTFLAREFSFVYSLAYPRKLYVL